MQIHRLTTREVETLKRDGVHADGAGLYLRVRGQARNWLFVYRWQKARCEMGLGSPPAVSLKKARERAQAAREMVADGIDPLTARKSTDALPAFGEVADRWIEDSKSSVRNSKSIDRWKRVLGEGGYADALRALRVDRVTTDDVVGVLRPIWAKGPTATLARGYIEAVLDSARAEHRLTGLNPAVWKGHLKHIMPTRQKVSPRHHAAIPYADVPAFMARLRTRGGAIPRLLEFTVLTAARSNEAAGATWAEIDLDSQTWTIPAARMKAALLHRVPLCLRAVEILKGLKMAASEPHHAVFGQGAQAPTAMAAPMLLRRMGYTARDGKNPASIHGMRSAFKDWAEDCTDYADEISEAALAHTVGNSVRQAYRRGDALEKRRLLMKEWDAYCATTQGLPCAANDDLRDGTASAGSAGSLGR